MKFKRFITLVSCILLPLAIGGISGFLTSSEIDTWFTTLVKPTFNPPNYLFAPVWTTIYTLMGISFFLVLERADFKDRNKIYTVFFIQLILNFFWSIIFFKSHQIGLAFIEIIFLWISIGAMIFTFYKISKTAAYLNIPYLLWVSFASFLNYAFYTLN